MSVWRCTIDISDSELQVEAHHFCACPNEDVRQCVIYDSDKPNARLIGTEYIISDKLFETLPEEEKVYWHSHKYEVQSGTLQVCVWHVVHSMPIAATTKLAQDFSSMNIVASAELRAFTSSSIWTSQVFHNSLYIASWLLTSCAPRAES